MSTAVEDPPAPLTGRVLWWRAPWLWAGGAWLAVYAAVAFGGQRFSTAYLGYGWQLVPFDTLERDPLGSVWYLHVQPPLWNLTLGGLARLSPFTTAATLQVLMAGFGVATAAFAAALLTRLGYRPGWATGLALLATLHPEVLKGAFEPNYELALAAMLVALAWTVARAVGPAAGRWALVAVAAVATVVIMTRSLYHPAWALAVICLVAWRLRGRIDRKVVLVALAVPVLVAGMWMVKNQVLFGRATLSSWFGMNLQRAVIPVVPRDELQALYDDGKVSDIALIGPFGNYDLYAPVMPPCTPAHDHAAVSEPMRTTDEFSPNFNYECFLPVFDQAGEDAWAVIWAEPDDFLEGRVWSARTMFAVSVRPSESDSWPMRVLDDVYAVARFDVDGTISTHGWGSPIFGDLIAPSRFGLIPVVMYAGLVGAGLWCGWLVVRRRDDPVRTTVLAVAGFTVLFTFVVGITGELGEQARFRTMTDPLVWTLAVAEALRLLCRWRRWTWLGEPSPSGCAQDP